MSGIRLVREETKGKEILVGNNLVAKSTEQKKLAPEDRRKVQGM